MEYESPLGLVKRIRKDLLLIFLIFLLVRNVVQERIFLAF